MKNMSSYCGLVIANIRASDKDLPVCKRALVSYQIKKFTQILAILQYVNPLLLKRQKLHILKKSERILLVMIQNYYRIFFSKSVLFSLQWCSSTTRTTDTQ